MATYGATIVYQRVGKLLLAKTSLSGNGVCTRGRRGHGPQARPYICHPLFIR